MTEHQPTAPDLHELIENTTGRNATTLLAQLADAGLAVVVAGDVPVSVPARVELEERAHVVDVTMAGVHTCFDCGYVGTSPPPLPCPGGTFTDPAAHPTVEPSGRGVVALGRLRAAERTTPAPASGADLDEWRRAARDFRTGMETAIARAESAEAEALRAGRAIEQEALANALPVIARAGDDAKALERARDLAHVWETFDPASLMSRRRAAAILSEVLAP
jgi:hypothetical protein